jgi:thiamine kinase
MRAKSAIMPDQWPHHMLNWSLIFDAEPTFIRSLGSGSSNQVFLIDSQGSRFVVRVGRNNSQLLGVNRDREYAILQAAVQSGLSPKIHYFSVKSDLLITEYIEGIHFKPQNLLENNHRKQLIKTIENVHDLKVDVPGFSYHDHLTHYWDVLESSNCVVGDKLCNEKQTMLRLAREIEQGNVICHHDLHPDNLIIQSSRMYVIDWEYAAPGWPAYDYAALCVEWKIKPEELQHSSGLSLDELNFAIDLYQHICQLWQCMEKS